MLLVGEQFDTDGDNSQICGAVVQNRQKGDKVSIWTQYSKDKDACMRIGRKFHKALDLPPSVSCGYQSHNPDTGGARGSSYNTPAMYNIK